MRKILIALVLAIFTFGNVATAQTNLALAATVSASASSSGSYGPSNWNDALIGPSYNFGWLGTDPTSFPSPAWLKYEWTSPQTISKLRFYNPTHTQGNFVLFNGTAELQYKSGSNWITIATVSGHNSTFYDVDFNAVTTTEVRLTNFNITGMHNPGWDEIEVYNIQTVSDDVGVYEVIMPDTIPTISPSIVDVKIVNYGMTNVDSFDICYILNFQSPKCMTFNKSDYGISPSTIWDTIILNLDTNITPIGHFLYTVWTELATDIDNSNDTASKHIFGDMSSSIKYIDFENSISIYPQPANTSITISGNIKNSEIEIYNLNGSLIKKLGLANEDELNIDVSDLRSGIYLVQVQNEDDVFTRKICITN